jgi:predicted XRE-type DNA-binding protein
MTSQKTAPGRRVIRGTKNVFADLGFADADVRQAKLRLAHCVTESLDNRRLSDAAAAKVLGVSLAAVRAIRSYRLRAFSIDRLMTWVTSLGHDIEMVIRRKPHSRKTGRLHVGGAEGEWTAYGRARRRALARLRQGLDLQCSPPTARDDVHQR